MSTRQLPAPMHACMPFACTHFGRHRWQRCSSHISQKWGLRVSGSRVQGHVGLAHALRRTDKSPLSSGRVAAIKLKLPCKQTLQRPLPT
eukprot:1144595-Pelagomonas_calceolata.AAC.2